MKELIDGTSVVARTFYYLLDWNEEDRWEYMNSNFGKSQLSQLNHQQFKQLFHHATHQDYKLI